MTRPNTGDASKTAPLEALRDTWEALGAADPLWAIMSLPEKRGSKWTIPDFMATGQLDAADILSAAQRHSTGPIASALEFGCGVGRITQSLAASVDSVTGVDISAPMLELARALNRHADRVEYVHNTANDLGAFADRSYDLVVSHAVIQHIPKPAAIVYVSELVRVARRVAVVQVAEPHWHWGVRPIVRRLVPDGLVERVRRLMPSRRLHPTLYGLRRVDVVAASEAAAGSVVEMSTLRIAGGWRSVRYVIEKR